MRIAMIGTGYVGLVSAACLSEFGHDVVCVDKDAAKIADLDAGRIPIFEPGLDEVVAANVKAGRPPLSQRKRSSRRFVGRASRRLWAILGPRAGSSNHGFIRAIGDLRRLCRLADVQFAGELSRLLVAAFNRCDHATFLDDAHRRPLGLEQRHRAQSCQPMML